MKKKFAKRAVSQLVKRTKNIPKRKNYEMGSIFGRIQLKNHVMLDKNFSTFEFRLSITI
jgi:hypothetical protein